MSQDACGPPDTWATIPAGQDRARKPGKTWVMNNHLAAAPPTRCGSPRAANEENL
jgi:hypothetical protein